MSPSSPSSLFLALCFFSLISALILSRSARILSRAAFDSSRARAASSSSAAAGSANDERISPLIVWPSKWKPAFAGSVSSMPPLTVRTSTLTPFCSSANVAWIAPFTVLSFASRRARVTSIFPFTVERSMGAATSRTLTAPFTVETLSDEARGRRDAVLHLGPPRVVVVVAVHVPAPAAPPDGDTRLLGIERELAVLVVEAHLDVLEPLLGDRFGRRVDASRRRRP